MYEKFTDRARKVVRLAEQEAVKMKHEYVGTEHLILGLTLVDGVGCSILRKLGVDYVEIKGKMAEMIQEGPDYVNTPTPLPVTPRVKTVYALAEKEMKGLGHSYIGTEHLLLGLARETEGVASQVLVALGIDFSKIEEDVFNLLGRPQLKDDLLVKIKERATNATIGNAAQVLAEIVEMLKRHGI